MSETNADVFEPQRARLTGLAYRMLGSLAEAQDVVQDAFLRVHAVDLGALDEPHGYLSKTVARLCLDRMKSARARRELYVGTWLPEPIVDASSPVELGEDLSFALLLVLERLSPPERSAFLLHDVFGMDFEAIAQVLGRSGASCRKLAERAREQVHAGRPRFVASKEDEQRLFAAFLQAAGTGDVQALTRILADDAVLYNDGGGRRLAAHKPVHGADKVARFFAGIVRKPNHPVPVKLELAQINGLPGCVGTYDNGDVAVAAIEVRDGRIAAVYIINNPEKLAHLRS